MTSWAHWTDQLKAASDPMPTIERILGMPAKPETAAELQEAADRQLISDAQDAAADVVDFDRHVAGLLTDLASRLERRMEP